ncbi:MAG: hypothetical protein NVSMB4_02090 [Acidimicrobiales bacterium]
MEASLDHTMADRGLAEEVHALTLRCGVTAPSGSGTRQSLRLVPMDERIVPGWLSRAAQAGRTNMLRDGEPGQVPKEASTAASTWRRVVGKTGIGVSAAETSSSISVQPSTTPHRMRPLTGHHLVSYRSLVDPVFKALADGTRRELLDALIEKDGQTLSALVERFEMTRIGVAKHLGVLESAGLVVSRRRGREKFHYLNPVPIRLIYDRWVSKYTETWAAGLVDLQHDLEATMEKVFEIYIRTTPERLWEAIVDPDIRSRYQFGMRTESDWSEGSSFEMRHPNAPGPLGEGQNLEVDPPRRLVQSMTALWGDDVASEGTSRVTWEIEPVEDSCRLTVTHDQLRDGANSQLYGGWPMILSGLKTWLETGQQLTTPGSLMYGSTP